MKDLIAAVDKALQDKNWYGALFIALAIPDICGRLQYPKLKSGERYVSWFEEYLKEKYTSKVGAQREEHVFLSGEDCYALRCALLHEGTGDITGQKARKVLENFLFMTTESHLTYMEGNYVNGERVPTTLQLNVERFCRDISDAAKKWLEDVAEDKAIIEELKNTIKIHGPGTVYGGIKFG